MCLHSVRSGVRGGEKEPSLPKNYAVREEGGEKGKTPKTLARAWGGLLQCSEARPMWEGWSARCAPRKGRPSGPGEKEEKVCLYNKKTRLCGQTVVHVRGARSLLFGQREGATNPAVAS